MITEVFIAVDRDEVYRATLPPGEYIIGRDADAQIRIDHPTISRRHAKLIVDEDQLVLADLDSGNGTMIEEVPVVGPRHFYEGQTARLGDVLLRARQNVALDVLPPSIGSYRKGDVVAAGGMGAIHEARQSAMGRKVAMKVMLREESKSGLRRFINEARITGMLEHPNIVPVHELGVDADGRAFYTMKFVNGTTLAEVLAGLRTGHPEAVKKYPLPFLLTVFQKVGDAIAFAHNRGVHHRDLKPENVMIGDFGEVLVMDWGLSKETGFASEAEDVLPGAAQSGDGRGWRTMDGSVLGTPAYMSPEQARGEINAVDARSDVYCLGAILHEILYLQPPASGSNAHDIVDKVGRGELDPVREMKRLHWPGGKIPSSLEAVRRKAMALEPDRRYQRVTDLQADLTAYQAGFATSAEEAGVATQAMLLFKRNRGVSLAVLGGLLLLAIVSLVFIWRLQERIAEIQKLAGSQKTLLGELQAALDGKEEALQLVKSEAAKKEQALALAKTTNRELEEKNIELEEALKRVERSDKRAETAEVGNEEAAKKFLDSAREAVREGNFDKAMRDTVAALERAPENQEYRELKADLLQSSGRLAEAAEEYLLAITNGAGDRAEANLALSMKYAGLQDATGSVKISDEAYAELSAALATQGRNNELPFLDAARVGGVMAGDAGIPPKLKDLEGWSDSRYEVSPDGRVDLDLSGLPVDSLEGLRSVPLRSLDLRGTRVSDLSPLLGIQLEILNVAKGTRDLAPLTQTASLREIDLRDSQVADLGPLAGASKLEKVWLDGTPVEDLKPLEGKPLRLLSANVERVKSFDVVGTLGKLTHLSLPEHAAGVPVAGLTALEKVTHPRFQAKGEIDGDKFKDLSRRTDEAWPNWKGKLYGLGVSEGERWRVTVVAEAAGVPDQFPRSFDLDLRDLEVTNLAPLRDIPVNRLYLNSKAEVKLKPLESHPTLRHLILAGANVASLQGVPDNRALKSIVLSTETDDVHRLYNRSNIPWAGYVMDPSTRLPTTTTKKLFEERKLESVLQPKLKTRKYPEVAFLFDDPGMDAQRETQKEKWQLLPRPKNGSRRPVWRPDPSTGGGMTGGHLEFFERAEDGNESYFVLPKDFTRQTRDLYGSSVGFELRSVGDGVPFDRVEFVIDSRGQLLFHNLSGRVPSNDWRKYRVTLREGDGWTVGSPAGTLATKEEMTSALANASKFLIRAEYFKGGGYERTGLDNVVLWDPEETNARVEEEIKEEWGKDKWISVESGRLDDFLNKWKLVGQAQNDRERVRVVEYKGRRLPLLVGAVSADQPARITIKPEKETGAGTLVRFAARGAPNSSGVTVRLIQGGLEVRELPVGDSWTEFTAELPQGGAGRGEELCVLEVWPKGGVDPFCFISGLELVPPTKPN